MSICMCFAAKWLAIAKIVTKSIGKRWNCGPSDQPFYLREPCPTGRRLSYELVFRPASGADICECRTGRAVWQHRSTLGFGHRCDGPFSKRFDACSRRLRPSHGPYKTTCHHRERGRICHQVIVSKLTALGEQRISFPVIGHTLPPWMGSWALISYASGT